MKGNTGPDPEEEGDTQGNGWIADEGGVAVLGYRAFDEA